MFALLTDFLKNWRWIKRQQAQIEAYPKYSLKCTTLYILEMKLIGFEAATWQYLAQHICDENHIPPHYKWIFFVSSTRGVRISISPWVEPVYDATTFLRIIFLLEYSCLHCHAETCTRRADSYLDFHTTLKFSCMQPSNCYSSFVLIIFSIRYLDIVRN